MSNHDALVTGGSNVSMGDLADIKAFSSHVVAHLKESTIGDHIKGIRELGDWGHEEVLADGYLGGSVTGAGACWEDIAAWWDGAEGVACYFISIDPFDDGGCVGTIALAHFIVDFAIEGSKKTLGLAVIPAAQFHSAKEVLPVAVDGDAILGCHIHEWAIAHYGNLTVVGLVWQLTVFWYAINEDFVFPINGFDLYNDCWENSGEGVLVSQEGEVSVDEVAGQNVGTAGVSVSREFVNLLVESHDTKVAKDHCGSCRMMEKYKNYHVSLKCLISFEIQFETYRFVLYNVIML